MLKASGLGELAQFTLRTPTLQLSYRTDPFKVGEGGGAAKSTVSQLHVWGEFCLVMLWFAFRIKPTTQGSLHCTFSYDLQCSSLAQVSLWATCVPCGWILLEDNTQEMCCTLGFDVLLQSYARNRQCALHNCFIRIQ